MDFLRSKINRLIRRRKPIIEDELELAGDYNNSSSCPWDTLPHLAVDKIFSNLCVGDRVRMRSVCKSWKSALDLPLAPEAPWLIMPAAAAAEKEMLSLKSMHENRIYRFKPPHLASRKRRRSRKDDYWCCCGSSDGWLLIAVGRVIRDVELLLWNPLSGETKNLPSLSTLPFLDRFIEFELLAMSDFIRRARVSSSSKGVVVVGVVLSLPFYTDDYLGREQLALCTAHDGVWQPAGGVKPYYFYQDICFHGGKLYASYKLVEDDQVSEIISKCTCSSLDVVVLGIRDDLVALAPIVELVRRVGFGVLERYSMFRHLVECSITGELLVVTAIKDECSYRATNKDDDCRIRSFSCTQTGRFEIHRFGDHNNVLEKIDGIGEQCLFVGQMGTVSLKDGGIGVVEADRIFFATKDAVFHLEHMIDGDDDDDYGVNGEIVVDTDFRVLEQGVFDVKRDIMEIKSTTNVHYFSDSVTGWFTPKLF